LTNLQLRRRCIDERKAHLSTLILSSQMTREQFDTNMAASKKTFLDYRTRHDDFERSNKIVNAGRMSIG